MSIRSATPVDAPAIARVHVDGFTGAPPTPILYQRSIWRTYPMKAQLNVGSVF